MWYSPTYGLAPSVALNAGPALDDGNINFLANQLVLTGGGQPGAWLNSNIVFTAPSSGLYSIAAGFRGDQQGVDSTVNVVANGGSLFSAVITSIGQTESYNGTVALSAGQTIEFAIGDPVGGAANTGMSAVITSSVPEASTLLSASLLLVIGSLVLYRHRKQTAVAHGSGV
jgi:hypothetical protein